MNNYNLSELDWDSNNGDMIIIKGLYTAKLSPKVTINVPLRIRMGMLKIVMLVVDMVP